MWIRIQSYVINFERKINIKKIRAQEESFGQLGLGQTTDCREWENFVFILAQFASYLSYLSLCRSKSDYES